MSTLSYHFAEFAIGAVRARNGSVGPVGLARSSAYPLFCSAAVGSQQRFRRCLPGRPNHYLSRNGSVGPVWGWVKHCTGRAAIGQNRESPRGLATTYRFDRTITRARARRYHPLRTPVSPVGRTRKYPPNYSSGATPAWRQYHPPTGSFATGTSRDEDRL